MLWAIDVGNTHTVVGLWDGSWRQVWRLSTRSTETEDEMAASLQALCAVQGVKFAADAVSIASVVPALDDVLEKLSEKWLGCKPFFLRNGADIGLKVEYQPATAVGADRLANALAALKLVKPPLLVVDFGTATTFDAISREGSYLGGSILPGVQISLAALIGSTAKLPGIALKAPDKAIGQNTVEALQSGLMFGYAGAIEALTARMKRELEGDVVVLATGGLGAEFLSLCPSIQRYEPNLTLEGLRIALEMSCSR